MHALRPIFFGVLAMAIVVAVSNVAVGYPINDWITWGALTYPVAFLVTDVMNRSFGASNARKVVDGCFIEYDGVKPIRFARLCKSFLSRGSQPQNKIVGLEELPMEASVILCSKSDAIFSRTFIQIFYCGEDN